MQITISARHDVRLDDGLTAQAHALLERLGHFGTRPIEGTVVFDASIGRPQVEVRLRRAGGTLLIATAEGEDFRSAIDVVEMKLRRQLERVKSRPMLRRPVPA